jgi:putative addiction module killer protein
MIKVIQTDIFAKWLDKLKNVKTQGIIADHLDRMKEGNLGNTRNVGEGVFEKKINFAKGLRLYYYFVNEGKIILLCGGDKSTQPKDIAKAKKIKKGLKL